MTSSGTTEQDSPPTATSPPPKPSGVSTPPLRVKTPTQPAAPYRTPSTQPSSGPAGENDHDSDPLDAAPTGGSTPSASSRVVKLDKRALADILREAVYVASGWAHEYLARSEEAQAEGLWLAEDRDQRQIGDPLASIGSRHGVPVDGGADVADLIAAGLGALAYITRNASKAWRIRRGRRQLADVDPITERTDQ